MTIMTITSHTMNKWLSLFTITPTNKQNNIHTTIGGKKKPLKAPKKEAKDLDDDDIAHQNKLKEDAKAMKEMAARAKAGGPLTGGGIKKSGKK